MDFTAEQKFRVKVILISGILTFLSLVILFAIRGIAPFGTRSLAVMDANIQYLDFFSYYKDVLLGKNEIGYTFGKTLGGSNIAVFSYYLASPFNFLLLFFDKAHLQTFFDIVVALKLSLAAMTFSFFSTNRFRIEGNESMAVYILTAMGYGLCQYNLAQSSNIMWLDEVYMMPLILLQVSDLVRGKKSRSLPFLVGAAIIFNWYSAGIVCAFSAFWFLFEFILRAVDEKSNRKKQFYRCAVQYVSKMVLGILMSAVLFFPTIIALKKSTRGSLHFNDLFDVSFLGEFPSVIQKYSYGATSDMGSVALFCGSLAIILALYTLFCREINIRKRLVFTGLFGGSLLAFYWNPLFMVFSLFQWVSSYHYRYSFIAVFSILFLAVIGGRILTQKRQVRLLFKIVAIFAVVQIFLQYCKPITDFGYTYKMIVMLISSVLLFSAVRVYDFKNLRLKKVFSVLLFVVGIVDLGLNANYLIARYSNAEVKPYQAYREAQEKMVSEIQKKDRSLYRISQTTTRNMGKNGTTAHYNEGLAYNYASISGYTSSPDDIQRRFLDKLGYRICGGNMCITNTSILGADSLLGVKYVMSSFVVQGLVKTSGTPGNGKFVYLNPYAFPPAFTYQASERVGENISSENRNPFTYQNALYKELFDMDEDLYVPVAYSLERNKDGKGAVIRLQMPDASKTAVYGSVPWKRYADSSVYINGKFLMKYACWLSPSVFYIPHSQDRMCEVEVRSNVDNFNWDSVQFYALDLDVLQKCAQIACAHKAEDLHIENGLIDLSVKGSGDRVLLSVPADDGWDIMLNGKVADVELVGDCLYSIALTDETNHITMRYHVQGLKLGAAVSLISVLGYCGYLFLRRKGMR